MARSIEASPPFAELVAKTNGSFLEGASHPEEIVERAHELGYAALGIVDTHGVYGAPRAHAAAKEKGLPLLVGAEIRLIGGASLYLLSCNRNGYGNLCELLTLARSDREDPRLSWPQALAKAQNLIALLPLPGRRTEIPFADLKSAFAARLYLVGSRFLDGGDDARLAAALRLSREWEIPVVASNEPLFHEPDRKPLHDVLTAIRHNTTLREGGFRLLPNAERHLKPRAELAKLFADFPEWLAATVRIASECRFSLDEIRYRYPTEWIPEGETGDSYLEKLTWQGARERYGNQVPDAVVAQIHHELTLIRELQYSDYFLTIWDVVSFARSRGILCQGRGSAANSIVCFVLGITAIDPVRMQLLFERFLSRERREPPDIDIDFEHERREEVIQYLYQRYGRHRAAITAETICFRRKSALREVAKVFELPVSTVEKLQTLTHRRQLGEVPQSEIAQAAQGVPPRKFALYLSLVKQIQGFPRHLGTHVGGFVLCQDRLDRNVPIEKAAMEGRTIIQWNKDDLDALGFVKVDVLGLGILTCIRKCFGLMREVHGADYTLATIPPEVPEVYDAICAADTVGVFQIESRAQMNMLPRLKPRHFYDLVVEVSIVRPGPIQGEMVHPYLRRRSGLEPTTFPHPDLEAILGRTYGVPLFQEQIMKMAMVVAGFSGGEADELRRAMGTWRRHGGNRLSPMGEKFRRGLMEHGVPQEFAERVFKQIEGFAEYGFPESHAASFALIAYATAWLKRFYPDAFLAALLNSQPMGFYHSSTLINDGKRHGVKVSEVDVNASGWDNRLVEPGHVRLGFREIRGLARRVGEAIERARAKGPFLSLDDFNGRVRAELPVLSRRDLFLLAAANAFEALGVSRRDAIWEIQGLELRELPEFSPEGASIDLPLESEWERVCQDYESHGVSLYQHPIALFRPTLTAAGAVDSEAFRKLRPGKRVSAAGIVICRQMPPTATGVLFLTLEDERGFFNLVIWRKVFEQYREALLTQSMLWCQGKVERAKEADVVHLIVDRVAPLLTRDGIRLPSHDWG